MKDMLLLLILNCDIVALFQERRYKRGTMHISCLKEIMESEGRVALTPKGAAELVKKNHRVFIERGAGEKSGFPDKEYRAAGARIVLREKAWREGELILKVKQPTREEFRYLKNHHIVFCFHHLAANAPLREVLKNIGVTAVDYGTIELPDGAIPILAEMSKIAGRIAFWDGAEILRHKKGVLLGPEAKAMIIGLGNAGTAASELILPTGAHLYALDHNPEKRELFEKKFRNYLPYQLWCMPATEKNIANILPGIDLLIGAAHTSGKQQAKIVSEQMIKSMTPNSVAIDISIDMGGCFATSRQTSIQKPTFVSHGIIHYGVPNMPGAYPYISTPALCGKTLPYILAIAKKGVARAAKEDSALARGINVYKQRFTHEGLAKSLSIEYTPLKELLK